jgi:PAS domain S-box-containing protein
MPFERLLPGDARSEFNAAFERAWSGSAVNLETIRLHQDGTAIAVAATLSAVRDPQGTAIGVSQIDRDIRERKRREEALAERERRLADLYDHSPDLFAFVELRSGRIVEFNETLVRMLGYAAEEVSTMPFSGLFAAQSLEALRTFEETLRRTGEVRDLEVTMVRKDGTQLDASLSATGERDHTGEVVRSRGVARDMTARKQAAKALVEASKMRERFLALVSHELRTPLYAVRSATSLLSHPGADEATRQRAIEVLNRQAAQMTRLLGDLLDVSLITHDRFELARVPLDLREPVRTAIDAVVTTRAKAGVRVVAALAEEPLSLLGDPARLEQVVTNLLNNAIRHSPAGTKVVVAAQRVGGRAQVTVTDEGEGIAPDRLQTIFELFSRTREPGSGGSGLGLGLGIARRIVAGHEGSMRAESEGTGRGAQFIVELPLFDNPVRADGATASPAKARVVLIEDQPDACDMATRLLEMRGHEVMVATTGSAGISAILEHRPDVALVDISLPDIDGYAVAREIRTRLGPTIPLIALTGLGQPEDVKRSHEAGFARHLTKPFDIEDLENVIQEFLVAPSHPRV